MENQSPILSVKPKFLIGQEVGSQLILMFISVIDLWIAYEIKQWVFLLPSIAFSVGFLFYLKAKKQWVESIHLDFYDDYFIISNQACFLKSAETTQVSYQELSKVKLTTNGFEEEDQLGTISFKKGKTPWHFYFIPIDILNSVFL